MIDQLDQKDKEIWESKYDYLPRFKREKVPRYGQIHRQAIIDLHSEALIMRVGVPHTMERMSDTAKYLFDVVHYLNINTVSLK